MRADLVGVKGEMIAHGRLRMVSAGAQEILIAPTDETAFAAGRFDRFVASVVSQGLAFRSLSALEQLIACAIAFEATCAADLKPILQGLRDPLHLGDGYYVSWKYGEEIRRVKLCALTLAVRERVPFICRCSRADASPGNTRRALFWCGWATCRIVTPTSRRFTQPIKR